MKLFIIRHGDPDYSIDSLTEQGKIEASLLADRLSRVTIKQFYVSCLGRAKDTAQYTLDRMGRSATVCEWLREFHAPIQKPNRPDSIPWDWLPQDWTACEEFYHPTKWAEHPIMKEGAVLEEYRRVTSEFDKVLAKHGYLRKGHLYEVTQANEDTLAFFCHFGVECVLLSHLLGISPMPLWHGFCAAPSSVTILTTEERRKGIASFRMNTFSDTSHLYACGEKPSFSARFCETYDTPGQRRDD